MQEIRNINYDKLRSYASVFSSTSFNRLIQYNDYSFLDSKIIRYDSSKIGKEFNSYYDYIRYIYKHLRKNYRTEYVYKNTLINELLIKAYGLKNTVVINEFRVGNSIADIVMFNGSSKAFEVKTELDTDKRLVRQLTNYAKIFNECYIVTHQSLTEKYSKVDDSIGIIELQEYPRSLKMLEVRPAKKTQEIDPEIAIRSIRTNEYKNIIKRHFGNLPEMNSFNMFDICCNLMKQIPSKELSVLFNEQLKKRKSNTQRIKSYYKELRQLGLSMNFDNKTYHKLLSKLIKPIRN